MDIQARSVGRTYEAAFHPFWDVPHHPLAQGPIFLRQPEIDEVYHVGVAALSHHHVPGFEVTVEEEVAMDALDTREHLLRDHQHALQAQLLPTIHEHVG